MAGKNILVLGATAASGLAFIDAALAHTNAPKLTLYVRSPNKLPADLSSNANVRVVKGSLVDENALRDALKDADTVVSFLGGYPSLSAFVWRTKATPIADSLLVVFKLMREKNVKRLFTLSTPAYYLPSETKPWSVYLAGYLPWIMVPQGNAEMIAIAQNTAAQDDFDWTVVRVPFLNNNDSKDLSVWAGLLGKDYKGTLSLSRKSLAGWILKEIGERKWVKGVPSLGNY